jgi:hypothetical protein
LKEQKEPGQTKSKLKGIKKRIILIKNKIDFSSCAII